jgi:hypothetical protein
MPARSSAHTHGRANASHARHSHAAVSGVQRADEVDDAGDGAQALGELAHAGGFARGEVPDAEVACGRGTGRKIAVFTRPGFKPTSSLFNNPFSIFFVSVASKKKSDSKEMTFHECLWHSFETRRSQFKSVFISPQLQIKCQQ